MSSLSYPAPHGVFSKTTLHTIALWLGLLLMPLFNAAMGLIVGAVFGSFGIAPALVMGTATALLGIWFIDRVVAASWWQIIVPRSSGINGAGELYVLSMVRLASTVVAAYIAWQLMGETTFKEVPIPLLLGAAAVAVILKEAFFAIHRPGTIPVKKHD